MYKFSKSIILFLFLFVLSCGGSSSNNSNSGVNADIGLPLNSANKAYMQTVQVPFDILSQFGGGSPAVVPKAMVATCKATSTGYTCDMFGDSGSCVVKVAAKTSGDGFNLELDCDNYSYTSNEGDDVVIDGLYRVDTTYTGNPNDLDVDMLITTPSGFSVAVNGEVYTYGSDFNLLMNMTSEALENDIITNLVFTVKGTVNGTYINITLNIKCLALDDGSFSCGEI